MILSESEFISYYETRHRFPDGAYVNPGKTLNRNQLLSKYRKYVASQSRREAKANVDREKVKVKKPKPKSSYTQNVDAAIAEAKKRDPRGEVWLQNLSEAEREFVASQMAGNPILQILDGAHVVSRMQGGKLLASNVDNILVLPRYVHANLDNYRDFLRPGCPHISADERDALWRKIVGEERWERLVGKMRKEN